MRKNEIQSRIPKLNLISKAPHIDADANMQLALEKLKPAAILRRTGFQKRSGDTLEAILYTLFILPMLQVNSICFFFGNRFSTLLNGQKDVIYRFMENQSVNWSLLTLKIAYRFYRVFKWDDMLDSTTALVVDDTLDERSGKKVEGSSLHWDHNKGTTIRGHQYLQLGLSNRFGFLPLIGHIFIGAKKKSKQSKIFLDKRNAVAKSYNDALTLTKHELLAKLLDKLVSFGFYAPYFLGDAWFGCKENIKLVIKHDMTGIFMMKRGKNKYRFDGELYSAKGLYRKFRRQMTKVKGKSFSAYGTTIEYNISGDSNKPVWINVQLVFSRRKSAPKSSWVVILSTDPAMEVQEILETYALRWNIEVYFKEIKQYFGFGKNQSWQYTVTLASIHLAVIRYILFYYLSLVLSSNSFAELRNQIALKSKIFTYGFIAWQSISRIIAEVLMRYSALAESSIIEQIQYDIENQVHQYFESVFPIALGILPEEITKLDISEKKGAL